MRAPATLHRRMDIPTYPDSEDLLTLCGHAESGSVSIYMGLPEVRTTVTAYRARLRQLVAAADAQTHLAEPAIRNVKAVEEFAQEPNLWKTHARGLAIFASRAGLETFYLDHPVSDLATVSEHFHLKPILEDLPLDRRCLVAVLAVDSGRLYLARRTGTHLLHEFELPDKMSPEHRVPGVQLRSQPGATGSHGAVFHGHGSEEKNKESEKRLRAMDDWLCQRINAVEHLPVVLAGVNYLTSAFRAISKCPNLIEDTIEGSRLSHEEIDCGASAILEKTRQDAFVRARERYVELVGGSRVLTQYEQILEAAKGGRVDTAFVAADRNQWRSGSRMGLREDVFDRIGVETYLKKGGVFVVPESEVPSGEGACAILRY